MMQQTTMNSCPECRGNIIYDYETGEEICQTCGLVLNDNHLDTGPEYRAYNFEETQTRSRVGKPATLTIHDKGLSTIIPSSNTDAHGRRLSPNSQAAISRLRRWQVRCRVDSTEKSRFHAMEALDKYSDKLNIPKTTREKAAYLLQKALAVGLAKGRTINILTAACLYMACRQTNILRNLCQISRSCNLDRKQVSACYRIILNTLNVDAPPLTPPVNYISRVSTELGVTPEAQKEAYQLMQKLLGKKTKNCYIGKDPRTVAASVIYLACERRNKYDSQGNLITQKRLALSIGITEVTIRNNYHELARELA